MKKLILAGVMALSVLGASAQTQKVGYINTEDLIGVMPEAEKADADLKAYQNDLRQNGEDMGKEAEEKADQFVKDSAKLSASMKEIKRSEIVTLYQKVQNWNQTAQDMYNKKAQDLITPIRAKALKAIQDVAKEKGYAYVLDASTSVILVSPPGDDLLSAVKTKLGIKDTPATKPTTPAGTKPAGN